MKSLGKFWNLFKIFFLNFEGIFSEEFLKEFFGRIFLEEFFGRNSLFTLELSCLSRFWGFFQDFVSMVRDEGRGGQEFRSDASSSHLIIVCVSFSKRHRIAC